MAAWRRGARRSPRRPGGELTGSGELPDDPDAALAAWGGRLAAAVAEAVPGWVVVSVDRLADAWEAGGGTLSGGRAAVRAEAVEAGRQAGAEVGAELIRLLAADVDHQDTTPLAVVRAAVRHPTGVLRRAGVPPLERDRFAVERFPSDEYGLVPASLAAVDPSLKDVALAWGAAKALAHRRRHRPAPA